MSAREPDFIEARAREWRERFPTPLFDLHRYKCSHPDEVVLKNPMQWIVFNEVFEAIPRSFFLLIERWWYPVIASNDPNAVQKLVREQMARGYPLFAVYDPKDRELCWQINARYFLANQIEFDVLAFRGNFNDARIVMWLTHAGHLKLIPLTDYTSRAQLVAYFDDPFVSYCFNWMAEKIFSIIPMQDTYATDDDTNAPASGETQAETPTKPSKDAPLEKWFDYYHACKKARIRYTLGDLATDTNRAEGYIRQKHLEYKAEHGT